MQHLYQQLAQLRFDRELTLRVFLPPLRRETKSLPILMYHSVSKDSESQVRPYYRVTTSPERFLEQMQWLRSSGYIGVSVDEALLKHSDSGESAKCVALTFDDGFRDFYTSAWPILKAFHFTATVYLPTAFISAERKSCLGRYCLTWDEVRELSSEGVRFGSHTVNHPKLYTLPWNEIQEELAVSKHTLEEKIQETVSGFAYPFAFPQEDRKFVLRFAETLRSTGYQSCVTTVIGTCRLEDDPFLLKRLPINECDDEALFSAKLMGAYDWMRTPQSVTRWAKSYAGLRMRH
jgi:peptidoglycan/xylan/chitin deacetylase (PgdA/CDA1 family)